MYIYMYVYLYLYVFVYVFLFVFYMYVCTCVYIFSVYVIMNKTLLEIFNIQTSCSFLSQFRCVFIFLPKSSQICRVLNLIYIHSGSCLFILLITDVSDLSDPGAVCVGAAVEGQQGRR